MKTKEFIRRAKELGFVAGRHLDGNMAIFARDGIIVLIDEYMPYGLIMDTKHLKYLTNELFDLCVEYARTPIEDRKGKEEEKKYYLRALDSASAIMGRYLNFDKSLNIYFLHNNCQYSDYKTRFTKKEIDEIKKELNTDLLEFEQIEVEE